jgi:hypothetical protein
MWDECYINPLSSSTFQNLSKSKIFHYGSGEAEGYVRQDIVQKNFLSSKPPPGWFFSHAFQEKDVNSLAI